ncbi:MAG: PepSY domain-containing protein [Planctomycetes bacterium]|nr:PepSY domain-containing protein [Planctomycetota bacterium]
MKTLVRSVCVVALLAGLQFIAVPGRARAEEAKDGAAQAKKVVEVLKEVKCTLVDAITKAQEKTRGTALEAELEVEGTEISYEVTLVLVEGEVVKFFEVEVNAKTGEVIEVEAMTPGQDDEEDEGEGKEEGEDEGDDEGDDEGEKDDD